MKLKNNQKFQNTTTLSQLRAGRLVIVRISNNYKLIIKESLKSLKSLQIHETERALKYPDL